jgi:hypothetical protein
MRNKRKKEIKKRRTKKTKKTKKKKKRKSQRKRVIAMKVIEFLKESIFPVYHYRLKRIKLKIIEIIK